MSQLKVDILEDEFLSFWELGYFQDRTGIRFRQGIKMHQIDPRNMATFKAKRIGFF